MSATSKLGAEWTQVKIKHPPLNAYDAKRGDPKVECLHCGHTVRSGASRIRSGTKDGVSACDSVSEEDKLKLGETAQKKFEQQLKKRKAYLDTLTHPNSDSSAKYTDNSSKFNSTTSTFGKLTELQQMPVLPDSSMPVGCPSMQHAFHRVMVDQLTGMRPGNKPHPYQGSTAGSGNILHSGDGMCPI
jgi:hypothetical protein